MMQMESVARPRKWLMDRQQRDGYVLVLVVMLLFGIMALAALVIDLGFARLTQRQMQTAVDSAALEGLRFRDERLDPNSTGDLNALRRSHASDMIAWSFDDDLNATLGDDGAFDLNSGQFGAGPVVEFTGGAGDPALNASQLMTVTDVPFYKPQVANTPGISPNFSDAIEGDMRSGTYASEPPPLGLMPEQVRQFHLEQPDYTRADFASAGNASFLVRMRRTGEVFEEEVGTSGPMLPYLFGRGSLMNRQLIGQGVKVRATGIADAVPALSIGRKIDQANPPVNGFAGLAVSVALWNELVNGPEQSESIGQRLIYFPAVVDVEQLPLVVGSSIDRQLAASEIQQAIIGTCYLPIYTNVPIGSSVERVIGFGLADVVVINPTTVQITASTSRIVKENASAVLTIAIDSAGFDECMTLNKQLEQPLLAPVSVR